MKKIGILTFHRAYNYGAVLQTYALQKVITEKGYECEIIDYRNPQIEKWFHNSSFKVKIRNFVKFIICHSYSVDVIKKGKKFNAFSSQNLKLSKEYKRAKDFKNDYDAIIVGSDQVWNLDLTAGDMNYFLPYENGAEKLTYSASFGTDTIPAQYKDEVRNRLSSFKSLLVREQNGIRIINELSGQESECTVDPTFLIDKDEWKKVSKPMSVKKPYVVLYLVAHQTYAIEIAKKMAEKKGCDVIYIDAPRQEEPGVINIRDVGPDEFLHLISNAECVVTTSFHGLILSVNHNIPFLFELSNQKTNANSRLVEVSKTYMLDKYQIVSNNIDDYIDLSYDWSSINKLIAKNRSTSLDKLYFSLL